METKMTAIGEKLKIENPRGYEACVVEHLRDLLAVGSPIQPDARRENFYEIDGDDATYYIHVSPLSGKIVLLARWSRQNEECYPGTGCFVA